MSRLCKHIVLLTLGLAACLSAAARTRGGEDYRLGAGDLLKISTFGYADLAADVRVSESGNITFPLIGQIAAEGLSTRELETVITQRSRRATSSRERRCRCSSSSI